MFLLSDEKQDPQCLLGLTSHCDYLGYDDSCNGLMNPYRVALFPVSFHRTACNNLL
jgi:hypothetical protein